MREREREREKIEAPFHEQALLPNLMYEVENLWTIVTLDYCHFGQLSLHATAVAPFCRTMSVTKKKSYVRSTPDGPRLAVVVIRAAPAPITREQLHDSPNLVKVAPRLSVQWQSAKQ